MQIKIDKFGRVLIPKAIRRHFNLKPGDKLLLQQEEERIILKPGSSEQALIMKGGVLVFSGEATGDLVDAIKTARDARTRHLSAQPD